MRRGEGGGVVVRKLFKLNFRSGAFFSLLFSFPTFLFFSIYFFSLLFFLYVCCDFLYVFTLYGKLKNLFLGIIFRSPFPSFFL